LYFRREVPHCRNIGPWPEPQHQVAHIANTAGRSEAYGQVKGLPTDAARPLRLVLRSMSSGEQRQVEGAAAYVAAVHVKGTPRIPRSVVGLAKIAEALCHAGC